MTTRITMLVPTRGRPEALTKSLRSLLTTADDPARVEILLAMDNDDREHGVYVTETLIPQLRKEFNCTVTPHVFLPLGYRNLHAYYNHLCCNADGDWLFLWNDDAIMNSKGWDTEIASYNGQFKLLKLNQINHRHLFALFPIVPREYFELAGYFSPNAQCDNFVYQVFNNLAPNEGRVAHLKSEVIHDRADLTGNNKDATYDNRQYMEGNPADPNDIASVQNRQRLTRVVTDILKYLEKSGQ